MRSRDPENIPSGEIYEACTSTCQYQSADRISIAQLHPFHVYEWGPKI